MQSSTITQTNTNLLNNLPGTSTSYKTRPVTNTKYIPKNLMEHFQIENSSFISLKLQPTQYFLTLNVEQCICLARSEGLSHLNFRKYTLPTFRRPTIVLTLSGFYGQHLDNT